MRYILTMLIAFHWMTVFAMLATVSTVEPQHGILPALRFLGAEPWRDAYTTGGGLLAAGLMALAFLLFRGFEVGRGGLRLGFILDLYFV